MAVLSKSKIYVYIALAALFMTSFPLFQGWVPIGDFMPRALFMLVSFFFVPYLLKEKAFLCLLFYYLVVFLSRSIAGVFQFAGYAANFLEMGMPLMISLYLFKKDDYLLYKKVARFGAIITLIILVMSVYVSILYPNCIREIVGLTASGDLAGVAAYKRMGLCNYSFAAVMMFIPGLMLVSMQVVQKKVLKALCLGVAVLSFFFMYKAETTTPMIICIYIIVMSFVVPRTNVQNSILLSILLIVLTPTLFSVFSDLLYSLSEGTIFEDKLNDISAASAGDMEGDLSTRYNYTLLTLDAFLQSPIFGSQLTTIGGHNYLLDLLARFGLVGFVPFMMFFVTQAKTILSKLTGPAHLFYLLCIVGWLAQATLKNISGLEYWTYLFIYIPCFLKVLNNHTESNHEYR